MSTDVDATLRAFLNTTELPSDPKSYHQRPPPLPGKPDSAMEAERSDERLEYASKERYAAPASHALGEEVEEGPLKPSVRTWTPSRTDRRGQRENGLPELGGPYDRDREAPPSLPESLTSGGGGAAAPATPTTPASQPASPQQASVTVEGRGSSDEEAVRLRRELDVRAAFSGLPKVSPHWTHRYMKMLVVGESGLGKTTFIKNLFAAYASDPDFPVNDASGPDAKQVFERAPQDLCTEIVLKDEANKVFYHYFVQDTPGYGDSTDLAGDREAVLDYVHKNNRAYLDQEQSPGRKVALHDLKDTRVDICLYFIPPHRLRQMDVEFMRELSQLVPVVPVLAKADTMTSEELKEFRHRVRQALKKASALWRFSGEALEEAGARHGPPFAVISSKTMDLSVGRYWPVRKYPWGSCEAMLTTHSDLPALRRLLFETGYLELKQDTELRYHQYRKHCCEEEGFRPLRPVRKLLKLAGAAAAVGLLGYLAINGVPQDLKDEVRRKETVRRVKEKVGEKVEGVVGGVQDAASVAAEKAANATHIARATAAGAVDRAAQALEGEEGKRRRAEVQSRTAYKRVPWWKFWGE